MTDPMLALSRRIGTTPGQAWTLSIGTLLAAVLLGTSLPPVLDGRGQLLPVADGAPVEPGGALTGLAPAAPPTVPLPLAPPVVTALPGAPLPVPQLPTPAPLPPAPAPSLPAPSDVSPAPPPSPAVPRPVVPGSLRVVDGGVSTPDPATPGLPADGLPVSARAGGEAEVAHVRLAGSGTTLALRVDSTVGAGEVQACPHTTADWTAARPQPRTPFDPGACVTGVVVAGVITFDLREVPGRSSRTGLALSPVPTADPVPSSFRLVLRPLDPGAPS